MILKDAFLVNFACLNADNGETQVEYGGMARRPGKAVRQGGQASRHAVGQTVGSGGSAERAD